MTKVSHAVAPLVIAALLLSGCAAATTPPATATDDVPSVGEETTASDTEPDAASYSAGPECDAHAAAKNASANPYDQQAVQVSIDELPFALANPEPVLCVLAMYSLAEPEDRPLGFELGIDVGYDGTGIDAFGMSPDLSFQDCYESAYACFKDTFGNIVVVGDLDASREMAQYYPNAETFLRVGVQMKLGS
jgi:hypothetical protein